EHAGRHRAAGRPGDRDPDPRSQAAAFARTPARRRFPRVPQVLRFGPGTPRPRRRRRAHGLVPALLGARDGRRRSRPRAPHSL
ncbi:MAG: hypothetical protein AVDCRST_MAG69-62, partial [uncultured Solirubrobacteraceae bacterium]